MTSVVGIPSTRVSDLFIRDQMLTQVQQAQLDLLKTETQLTTGHRFSMPSEDPVAALNVTSLQSLLERKAQVQGNLSTTQTFLSASDSALSQVSATMADVRGIAVSVIGTTATDVQRRAAAEQVGQALTQLIDTGNQTFRGRYLFAGSTTAVRPFQVTSGGAVIYLGNEQRLASFSDIDLMSDSNITGSEVFGAVSAAVLGTSEMTPVLSLDTPLADLREGEGIRLGSIEIDVGNYRHFVDLSSASTIGDVAQLIDVQTSGVVKAHVTNTGLALEAADSLFVREVGGGKTAYDLGILTTATPGPRLEGKPLNPVLKATTPLSDILGTRASSLIVQGGIDNDMIIEAGRNGADLNDIQITFVDDGSVATPHGGEYVVYDGDSSPKTLVVYISDGTSMVKDVINAINKAYNPATMPLTARLEGFGGTQSGFAVVHATPAGQTAGVTAGGSGRDFDRESGLQIVNGGNTYTVDFRDAATIEDVLNALNASEAGVLAEINADRHSIDVRSRVSGCDFAIGENGGRTAADLGLRTFTASTSLDELNFGNGVQRARQLVTAAARCLSGGDNNDLLFTAVNAGSEWDDFTIEFVDDDPLAANDGLTYDPGEKTLTFEITSGATTASQILAMLRANPTASEAFEAKLLEENGLPNDGSGPVAIDDWTTSSSTAAAVDFTITRKDGVAFDIDLSDAKTIGDVLDLINNNADNCRSGIQVRAQLAAFGNGIELVDDDPSPGTLTVTRSVASTAAIDLGLIPKGQDTSNPPATFTAGRAEVASTNPKSSLVFSAKTPGNWAGGVHVLFRDTGTEGVTYDQASRELIFTYDGGVTTAARIKELLEQDPNASGAFSVAYATSDPPSDGSGIFDPTAPDVAMSVVSTQVLSGSDSNPLETESLFTSLLRLQNALLANDQSEAGRALQLLDRTVTNMNFSRAELGSRQQGLDAIQSQVEQQDIELQSAMSEQYDADIVTVVSQLTSQQVAYQASMKAMAMISQMSLLDYL